MTDHAPPPAPYRLQASPASDVSLGGVPVETIITTPTCPQSLPAGLRLTPLDISPGPSGHHQHRGGIAGGELGVERTGRLLGVGEHMEGSVASRAGSDPSGSGSQLVLSRSAGLMPSQSTPRKKPHLQGRFSGRLETKEDEKKLQDECKLLGPLVGGVGKRGEKNRMTLAKIVRAISSGDVRKYCEEREHKIHEVEERIKALEVYYQREIALLKQENALYRSKLEARGGEDMSVRQATSAHYAPEPIGTYGHNIGVDVSSLPFLLPAAQNPSAAVIQGPVSGGAVHTFPLQQQHAHLAVPSMPHHSMVGGMPSNILRDQMHTAKPLLAEELQARSQMVHQVRQGTIVDGSLKRKRDEFNKAAEGMIGLKPAGLDEDTIVADGVSPVPKEEASEPPTKTFHLTEHQKIASSHVLKAHSIQSQNSSDSKPPGSSPFSVGRTSGPTSNPQQAILANGTDKGSAQGLSYSSDHVASSLSFQSQKMNCRVDSGPYHTPLHHRNYPAGNGLSQQWLRQASSIGNQFFMGEQERYYQHIPKESLQQHNSVAITHPLGAQLVATPSAHDPASSLALASDVTQTNGDPSVADHRNTAEMDMGHGVSSLLPQGVRSVSGGHAAMVSSQTGVNTEVGHQI